MNKIVENTHFTVHAIIYKRIHRITFIVDKTLFYGGKTFSIINMATYMYIV